MKWIYLLSLCLFMFFASGCCIFRKSTKTVTVTETKIRIDTVIKVIKDTVTKIVEVPLTDTAQLENETSIARSYYDIKLQKLVLSLKGKIFDVPVVMDQIIKTKEKNIESKPSVKLSYLIITIIGFAFIIILFGLIYNLILKKLKIL